jgi:hypothetical protein
MGATLRLSERSDKSYRWKWRWYHAGKDRETGNVVGVHRVTTSRFVTMYKSELIKFRDMSFQSSMAVEPFVGTR